MESTNFQSRVLSFRIRWLSLASGCITAIMLASFSWPLAFSVLPIILGAALQPHLPRLGRWSLYVGAFLITVVVVPTGIVGWVETAQGAGYAHDALGTSIFLAWTIAPAILLWCDTELVLEAIRERRARHKSSLVVGEK